MVGSMEYNDIIDDLGHIMLPNCTLGELTVCGLMGTADLSLICLTLLWFV